MFKQIYKYANWNLTIFPFRFDNIFFDNIILSLQISWFIFTKSCSLCFWRPRSMIALSRVQAEQGNSEEFQYKWCRIDLIPRKEAPMPARWLHMQRVYMDGDLRCRPRTNAGPSKPAQLVIRPLSVPSYWCELELRCHAFLAQAHKSGGLLYWGII